MPLTLSPIADQRLAKLKPLRPRNIPVHGLAVHQTGSSEALAAVRAGQDPFEALIAYYRRIDSYSGHYVGGYDGRCVQVVDEALKANHIGFEDEERDDYLDGDWKDRLPVRVVDAWMAQWGSRYKSPAHLFPGRSANHAYVGLELLPIVEGSGAVPMRDGLLFTRAQHLLVARLAVDLSQRHSWPLPWHRSGRLVGHEDVNPCARVTSRGCWDPGWLRAAPWFDFDFVRTMAGAPRAT